MKIKRKLILLLLLIMIAFTSSNIKLTSSSPSATLLYFNPPIAYAEPGVSFKLNITVENAEYLFGWQVNISFNPSILKFINITEGSFLKDQPEGTFSNLRNETNWVLFAVSTIGPYLGVSASGVLGTIEFKVLAEGETVIEFDEERTYYKKQMNPLGIPPQEETVFFTTTDGVFINTIRPPVADFSYSPMLPAINQSITFNASASKALAPYEITRYIWDFGDGTTTTGKIVEHNYTKGGAFTVTLTVIDNANATELIKTLYNTTGMPRIWYELYGSKSVVIELAFAHDIAITQVTPSKTEVNAGETILIDVVIRNKGVSTESFSVKVYYDGKEIATKQVVDLESGEEITLTFEWDTTNVAEGTYQILAKAIGVKDDGNPDDNEFPDGTIRVQPVQQSFPTLLVGGIGGVVIIAILALLYIRKRKA
jgi:PKD repeat protein